MVTFKDLVTLDISDSPSDRMAAPFLYFLTFPVVIPCSIVYYSAKGIKHAKEKIVDGMETKKYYKEMEKIELAKINGSEKSTKTEVNQATMPVVNLGSKKSKRLILKRDNKKM